MYTDGIQETSSAPTAGVERRPRLGLIARCDARGLGHLTKSFFDHMHPDKTLVIELDFGEWDQHPEWYDHPAREVEVVSVGPDLRLRRSVIDGFLKGLDVVYTAETWYDDTLVRRAHALGVKVVCHGMPELCDHRKSQTPAGPVEWWWPTGWLTDNPLLPDGPIVPIPHLSKPDHCMTASPSVGPLQVLHVAAAAMADRNGTNAFAAAMNLVEADINITIVDQGARNPRVIDMIDRHAIAYSDGNDDRWINYVGQHVLVHTRRYGGLSITANEAAAAGLALVLTDRYPENNWPGLTVPSLGSKRQRMKFGNVQVDSPDPAAIASAITLLADNRDTLAQLQADSLRWSEAHSWERLAPTYWTLLAA